MPRSLMLWVLADHDFSVDRLELESASEKARGFFFVDEFCDWCRRVHLRSRGPLDLMSSHLLRRHYAPRTAVWPLGSRCVEQSLEAPSSVSPLLLPPDLREEEALLLEKRVWALMLCALLAGALPTGQAVARGTLFSSSLGSALSPRDLQQESGGTPEDLSRFIVELQQRELALKDRNSSITSSHLPAGPGSILTASGPSDLVHSQCAAPALPRVEPGMLRAGADKRPCLFLVGTAAVVSCVGRHGWHGGGRAVKVYRVCLKPEPRSLRRARCGCGEPPARISGETGIVGPRSGSGLPAGVTPQATFLDADFRRALASDCQSVRGLKHPESRSCLTTLAGGPGPRRKLPSAVLGPLTAGPCWAAPVLLPGLRVVLGGDE
ncbi:hypothetical protein CB1_000114015 [Camelus ferus]|nr:hypothetical protein CB1_000114015 [Camelus ferus]